MRPVSSIRHVYEDFRPLMEPEEDPQSNITRIHLPGFVKEQIRIIVETSRGVLRVRGERPIGANKSIRFLEELPVPEFCDTAQITAKFEAGVLRIAMPKKTETPIPEFPPPPPETLAEEEAEARKGGIEAEKRRAREERKLMVNLGVAVLVIAAFIGSGWISYSMLDS